MSTTVPLTNLNQYFYLLDANILSSTLLIKGTTPWVLCVNVATFLPIATNRPNGAREFYNKALRVFQWCKRMSILGSKTETRTRSHTSARRKFRLPEDHS